MRLGDEKIAFASPHRAPEWRWLRATWLREKKEVSLAAQHDDGVRAAYEFSKQLYNCRSASDYERMYFKYPDEYSALSFWVEPVGNISRLPEERRPTIYDRRRQATIEAYLLSGINHDEIGLKLGVTPSAVGVYENWFFDFRKFRSSPLIISTLYIRGDVAGTHSCDFEHLLRLYGWKYGAQFVDELVSGTAYSEKLVDHLRADKLQHLVKNAALLARGANIHPAAVFEATSRTLEIHDRRKQFDIENGKDFKSEEEANWVKELREDMNKQHWCMVDIPPGAEKSAQNVEHRLAVQLGYEPAPVVIDPVKQD